MHENADDAPGGGAGADRDGHNGFHEQMGPNGHGPLQESNSGEFGYERPASPNFGKFGYQGPAPGPNSGEFVDQAGQRRPNSGQAGEAPPHPRALSRGGERGDAGDEPNHHGPNSGEFGYGTKGDGAESGEGPGQQGPNSDEFGNCDSLFDCPVFGPMPRVFFGQEIRRSMSKYGIQVQERGESATETQTRPVVLEWASDVPQTATEWLWPGRIPLAGLTLLAGDATRIASLVAHDLAARMSRGGAWPDAKGPDGSESQEFPDEPHVVYCSPPRERESFCLPGLARAGADLDRLACLDGVFSFDEPQTVRMCSLWLPDDLENLRGAIRKLQDLRLIVFDPIEAFFDSRVRNSAAALGEAAERLAELAYDYEVAIVAVTRLKPVAPRRRHAPAFENKPLAAAADVGWGIVRSQSREDQALLVPIKTHAAGLAPALKLTLKTEAEGPRIQWDPEPVDIEAGDLEGEEGWEFKFSIASAWLRELLSRGPRPKEEIVELAAGLGFSRKMLRNVRTELGVKISKAGFQGKSVWSLPQEERDDEEADGPSTERAGGAKTDEGGSRREEGTAGAK